MGLIRAALGAASGVLSDQWKEFFYCEAIPETILVTKGQKRVSGRSTNISGEENIITNGSGIAVADGQCMIIVEQGKILDISFEPGQYTFDIGGEPTLFAGGSFGDNFRQSMSAVWERFKFGGIPGKDTRIYYFNLKELVGNKYGTASPVAFRVVDARIGLDIDIGIRCFGEYSYRIANPILFYTNVSGNVSGDYNRETLEGTLRTELLTALQPAFARIGASGVRYSELMLHTSELAAALNEELSAKWRDLRGLEIVSFGISSVSASEKDEDMIKELQRSAVFTNPNMAAATLVSAQADAMRAAASNESGAMMGFMGLNAATGAGGANAQNLYTMGQQTPIGQPAAAPTAAPAAAASGWTCTCGHTGNTGKFCAECGKPQPTDETWTCSCGHSGNTGKFCAECGQPKPAAARAFKCDKCGWEPPDPANPPKFCPECGDPFNEEDLKR